MRWRKGGASRSILRCGRRRLEHLSRAASTIADDPDVSIFSRQGILDRCWESPRLSGRRRFEPRRGETLRRVSGFELALSRPDMIASD
jgi:hypothetical protein